MKCKVCGAESGKYPLCRVCNIKKEKGDIIKCSLCGQWHSPISPCSTAMTTNMVINENEYVYDCKKTLISNSEQTYYTSILAALPEGYNAFPQVNLATFITKNDNSPFHNELFRNVDFLVTNGQYKPLFVIEINDQTHLNKDRKERDEKVQKICEEAGVPIVKFWTSYGVNSDYISKKINETIASLPVERIHHFNQQNAIQQSNPLVDTASPTPTVAPRHYYNRPTSKKGCYVATCVYGSYDCPQVWTLRRYRDNTLASTWYGRAFIHTYYAISPTIVKWFGHTKWFNKLCKRRLDRMVKKLLEQGVESTPYEDKNWRT